MAGIKFPKFIADMTLDQLEFFLEVKQKEFRKLHPHADRNKALTGNPYYKLDGEKIFCLDCGQRLGNMIDICPICNHHATYVYESMLENPADPRWRLPQYRKAAISSQQEAALYSLVERQRSIKNPEDLV